MDIKTEELLCMLLWTCETISRPTFRNLTESFECWAYRRGFLRQLQRLEKQQWIERSPRNSDDRLHRLTEAGRFQAMGGRDPEACWNRRWDGRWRLVLFDVPETLTPTRDRLRRYLRSRGFGCLQNSVWVTPHSVIEERDRFAEGPVNVGTLIVLEARPCAGETDEQIVTKAWDFADLNQRYVAHQAVLTQCPRRSLASTEAAHAFHRWFRTERQAWTAAIERDPLLPESLLPPGYAGREAWRHRLATMVEAGKLMRAFDGL